MDINIFFKKTTCVISEVITFVNVIYSNMIYAYSDMWGDT